MRLYPHREFSVAMRTMSAAIVFISQGRPTRLFAGYVHFNAINLWCQRIWSTIATRRQRGKPAFAFLLDATQAHIHLTPAPSLIYA